MKLLRTMMSITAASIVLLSSSVNAQNYQWAKSMGSTGNDYGTGIAVDNSGNVYNTGTFQGTVDFKPGAGTYNLTSAGSYDIFVSKFDSTGNFIWAKRIGDTFRDEGSSIALDTSGNVYITGGFEGTNVDFDPGSSIFNMSSVGLDDAFVCKLDPSGNFEWATQLGGTGSDYGQSIFVDSLGRIYVTGHFEETADFGFTTSMTSAGFSDAFVCVLGNGGSVIWAKQMGGYSNDEGLSIAVHNNSTIYTTGIFDGTADFDPDSLTDFNLTTSGSDDIFVTKLSITGGAFMWAKQIGGSMEDQANSIVVDNSGNVYITGGFEDTADFDPDSFGTFDMTSSGYQDVFVCKLDALGNFLWAKQWGSTAYDYGNSITLDPSGNIYITGTFGQTVDFDPGAGTFNMTSAGCNDIFISKLDNSGNFIWAMQLGDNLCEEGFDVTTDAFGNLYAAGHFFGTADFAPEGCTAYLTSVDSSDIIFAKYESSVIPSTSTISGIVTYPGGIVKKGTVSLIEYEGPGTQMNTVSTTSIDSSTGSYAFTNVQTQSYLVRAIANESLYKNTIPTYHDNTVKWFKAVMICGSNLNADISMTDVKEVLSVKNIFGSFGFGFKSGKTADPVSGVNVFLVQASDTSIISYTVSDTNGNYEFNVDTGTYTLYVDIAGLDMDSTYTVTLTAFDSVIGGLDFIVDTTAGKGSIFIDNSGTSFIPGEFFTSIFKVNIYPNPFRDYATIEFENLKEEISTLTIYNLLGQPVRQIDNISNGQIRLHRDNLTNGLYFFQLRTQSEIVGAGKLMME